MDKKENFVTNHVKRQDINDDISILTFYNDDAELMKSGKLQNKEIKLMKGSVNGVFNGLKELLNIIGGIAVITALGYGAYKGTEIVNESLKEAAIDKEANDNYIFLAQSLDSNILIAFLNEVNDNLYEKEIANNITEEEFALVSNLQNNLRKIEELQLFHDQAIASGNNELSEQYNEQISSVVTDATIDCGNKGHIIGSSNYYKYVRAIFYDGRIMYLASDVDADELGFEDTINYSLNGLSYITSPRQDESVEKTY